MVFDDLLLEKQNACGSTTLEGDIVTWTVSIYRRTISNSLDKLSERMQISFVCFDKILRT